MRSLGKTGFLFLALFLFIFAAAPGAGRGREPGREIEAGLPFLRNYGINDYRASAQNWAVVQDRRGVVYAGNNSWVLEFDGVRWRLIPTRKESIVRSLAVEVRAGGAGFPEGPRTPGRPPSPWNTGWPEGIFPSTLGSLSESGRIGCWSSERRGENFFAPAMPGPRSLHPESATISGIMAPEERA